MKALKKWITVLAALGLLTAALAGCSGGGGGGSTGGGSGVQISGTVATGNPIAGATVSLVDKAGNKATGTTGTDGSFSINATGTFTPPFMLMASKSGVTYYSVSADANPATINITPLTDMIIRTWYNVQGNSVDAAFSNPTGANAPPTPTEVKVIGTVVENIFAGWLQKAGIDTSTFNLISTPFAANGTGLDGVLNMTTVDPTTGSIVISNGTITQDSTLTAGSGNLGVSSTSTTTVGTSSALTTTTVVPTTSTQSTALDGINTTVSAFAATINQKGASLSAADIAPYVDPGYLDDGKNAAQWENQVVNSLKGLTISYSGLQINSLDTTNNVADVSFQFSKSQNGVTVTNTVTTYFRLISTSWLISGNGHIAGAYATTWAWMNNPSTPKSLRLEVNDPLASVMTVTVVSGATTTTVPMVCDKSNPNLPSCGSSYGSGTQRAFQLDVPNYWPALPSTYTFTLATASTTATYTSTVDTAYGYLATGATVTADFPSSMTLISPSNLTYSQIVTGGTTTVTGSVFVPLWVTNMESAPHFNYEAPNGASSSVANQVIFGSWDAGVAVPGQVNNFTIVIPAATSYSPITCPSGSGTCYNITFQGVTGDVEGGWFGEDACFGRGGNEPESCTNGGIEMH